MHKDNSAYHAQSSHHSTRPRDDEEEVNQNDLGLELNQQDLCPRINNHHRERDAAEHERRRRYDEKHGVPAADHQYRGRQGNNPPRQPCHDYEPSNNIDGFSAFSNQLRAI